MDVDKNGEQQRERGESGSKRRGKKRPREEGEGNKDKEANSSMETNSAGKSLQTYIQILGTDTGDTCPSVMVFSDNCRYLFNVGDGLQVIIFSLARSRCQKAP
jgi:hypothetical protein